MSRELLWGTASPQRVNFVSPVFMQVVLRPRVGRFLPHPLFFRNKSRAVLPRSPMFFLHWIYLVECNFLGFGKNRVVLLSVRNKLVKVSPTLDHIGILHSMRRTGASLSGQLTGTVWLEVGACQKRENDHSISQSHGPFSKRPEAIGGFAHKPRQRSTAAKASTALYVVCDRNTTLKSSIVGRQKRQNLWFDAS